MKKQHLITLFKSTVMAGALFGGVAASTVAFAQDEVLNYRTADIRAFIDDISTMTGATFIIDPRVQGNISLVSRDPVPQAAVFDLFLSTLRVHGYTAVPSGNGAYKIVPDDAAATDYTVTDQKSGDRMSTRLFRLDYVDSITALNSVKPIIHQKGRAIAHRNNNFLLIVDYASNLMRIEKLLGELDKDPRITRMVTLANTPAEEMRETITALRSQIGGENAKDASLAIVPIKSSNTLVLKGSKELLEEITPLITELDERNARKGKIAVIKLKHADAKDLKPMLDEVSKSLAASGVGAKGAQTSPSTSATISFHEATNTLVINAEPAMQKALSDVVRELDIPRTQVLVEAIIVEMSDQAAKELGVQYILSGQEGGNVPFTATNYSNTAPNILAATGALLLPDTLGEDSGALDDLRANAVNSLLGQNGFSAGIAGQSGGTLFGVIVNALEQDIASNVLSTPSIMTLDNAPAHFLVGQEIPISTGEALGNNNSNPFRTIERKEVGITLDVVPHITEGEEIRLEIRQEVSSVAGSVNVVSGELITNTREMETQVRVRDGEIIVLGGLIEQDERINLEKVPLLGDIPLLGKLFQSENKSLQKTNLMVFIRPRIINDADDSREVTNRKFQLVRQEQKAWTTNNKAKGNNVDYILEEVIGGAPVPLGDAETVNSNKN